MKPPPEELPGKEAPTARPTRLEVARRRSMLDMCVSDPAFYRETAERARRLASKTTDLVLQANLLTFAAAYEARAAAIEAKFANTDPDDG